MSDAYIYDYLQQNPSVANAAPADLTTPEGVEAYAQDNPSWGGTPLSTSFLNQVTSGGGGGGGGGGSSLQSTYDPQQAALYDQAIGNTQSAIDRIPGQLESGYSSIDSSYKNALAQLLGARNQAESTYNTNTLQNKQDWRGGKNTISDQAGSSLRGLLRLLGIRGAGGSSAFLSGAPGAVIDAANQQRGTLGQTFGRNAQSLDTVWNNYLTDYGNQKLDVANQRDTNRQALKDQIDQNKANLLQTLATLQAQKASYIGGDPTAASQTYLDKANSLLDRVGTTKVAPINYTTKAYEAPSLDKYIVNPNAAPQYSQGANSDSFSPYLATLMGKDKKLALGA